MMLAFTIVICSLLSLGIGYLIQPAWTLMNSSLPWTIFVTCIIFSIGLTIWNYNRGDSALVEVIPWGITAVVFLFIIVVSLIGAPVFNSNPYRDAISIEQSDFQTDFEDISSVSSFSFMDLDTAQRVGDRVLGKVPNAAWYNVSQEYNLINYQGHQYRVSPLEYRDIFAYLKAKSVGIPGYVLVDVDTMESIFVQTEKPIIVSPSACFSQKLSRVLRGQFPWAVFEESFMEIDETGYPYWITAVTEPHAGLWGAPVAKGYIITDACTAESKYYGIDEEKPEWLDHIYSLRYLMERAEWHYGYVHGWWNISGTDVKHTTWNYKQSANKDKGIPAFYGYNCVQGSDGNIKIYTGLTPANKTESNVGFLMVDCVTGKYVYYDVPGAEESSAQSVVEGIIQQMGYESTFPVMVNIKGHPSYLMSLKDKSGLIKKYAIVNYENYSQAYVGDNFEDTMQGYLKVIGEVEEDQVIVEEPVDVYTKSGPIIEKYQAEIDGTTFFYYVIDDEIFKASITINEEQVTFKPGFTVTISYSIINGMNVVSEISK